MTAAHPTTRTAVDELLPEWDTRTVQLYMAGLLAYAKERGLEVSVPQQAAELILDAFNRLAATVTDPKCMDEWACMMPGDCSRAGHCLADGPKIESAEALGAGTRRTAKWWADQLRAAVIPCTPEHIGLQVADMLESQARVIAEHNKRCERECCGDASDLCECPRRFMIDTKETQ